MNKRKKKKDNTNRYLFIAIIILIIIIILLLLRSCEPWKKWQGRRVDICDNGECKKPTDNSLVNCLSRAVESTCMMPDFNGKTKNDVYKWLNKISNEIYVRYEYIESDEEEGTIINQTVAAGTPVSNILDENLLVVIYISKGKSQRPITPIDDTKPGNTGSDNTNSNNNNNTENNDNQDTDEEEEEELPLEKELIVKDSRIKWGTETEINIFANSMFDKIIAPESSNTYRFSVLNNTDDAFKYKVIFTETNNYNINMKYKLRKNNSYVIDEYVSIDQIHLEDQLLNSKKSDTLYLEWKWISSDNDTEIGATQNVTYNLKIEVKAEGIDE